MNTGKMALNAGIWYLISNFLVKGMNFFLPIILVHYVSKENFGEYNHWISLMVLASSFITLNLEASFISARFDFFDNFDEYIYSMAVLSIVSSLFWFIAVNICYEGFFEYLKIHSTYLNYMILYLLFLSVVNIYQARERYLYRYKSSVAVTSIIGVGTTIVSLTLVNCVNDKLLAMILGKVLPIVFVGCFLFYMIAKSSMQFKFEYWKYVLPIILPYIPHVVGVHMLSSMDKIMITQMLGNESTAIYSLASVFGAVFAVLSSSLNAAFSPWQAEKLSKKEYLIIREFSYIYIFLFVFVAVHCLLLAPELVEILAGERYIESAYIIAPLIFSYLCQFMYTLYVNVEQFLKRTKLMMVGTVFTAIINYCLNILFIPLYGIEGAAYATAISYFIQLLVHQLFIYKMGYWNLYDYKYLFAVLSVCSFLTISRRCVYECGIVRMIIFSVIYSLLFYEILLCRNKNGITLDLIFKNRPS